MSRVKQDMDDREHENDLSDFLKQLLEKYELKGALEGIAKQVISKGVKSMTDKQKAVVDNFVENYRRNNVCDRCSNGNVSNLTDYIFIYESSHNLCPMCEYDREKFMED